jgi:hypothetical protein
MDSLSSKLTPGDINVALQALRELPPGTKGLTALYGQAMKRINSQEEDCRALAHKVLSWVTHAKRPLTVVELQHALAVRPGTTELDEGFIPEVEDLLSVCAGLTTTDVQSGTIRWIHYTTQEYFERTWETWLPDSQMEIGKTCIVYISFDTFASGFSPSFEDFVSRVRKYPLYCYAAKYWGGYIRAARCKRYNISSLTPLPSNSLNGWLEARRLSR